MTYPSTTGQPEGASQQAVAVLDELMSRAAEFELAAPPPALARYREKPRRDAAEEGGFLTGLRQ